MNEIKVDRVRLLDTLKSNRGQHKHDVDEARKVWKKKAVKALKKAAKKAEEEGVITDYPLEGLPMPTSFVTSYDDAIEQVEWDNREEIELTTQQFASWIQDNWNWRGAFVGTQSLYNSVR